MLKDALLGNPEVQEHFVGPRIIQEMKVFIPIVQGTHRLLNENRVVLFTQEQNESRLR